LRARFPGRAGNLRVTFTLRARDNARAAGNEGPALTGVQEYDAVWAVGTSAPEGDVYLVRQEEATGGWTLTGGRTPLSLGDARTANLLLTEWRKGALLGTTRTRPSSCAVTPRP
jgi:hypothetical protein